MVKPKPAKTQPRTGGYGKFYALLGLIAVVAAVAIVFGGGKPKLDTFPVDPSLPPVQVAGYTLGDTAAPVHVMEFADFECPSCMQYATITEPDVRKRLVQTGQISYTYYFFPLEQHRSAASAAYAAACAGDQGKFWPMHDAIYNGFDDWAEGRARDPKKVFRGYAERIGANVDQWESCYDSDKFHALITAQKAEGMRRGVDATPTFFIGDVRVPGAVPYDRFKAVVDSVARAKGVTPATPAAPSVAGDSARTTTVPVRP